MKGLNLTSLYTTIDEVPGTPTTTSDKLNFYG